MHFVNVPYRVVQLNLFPEHEVFLCCFIVLFSTTYLKQHIKILQFPVSSPVGPLCSSEDLPEDDALALALVVPESPPAVNLPSWRRPLASSLCASKSPNELPKSASSVTSRYSVIVSVSTSPWKRAWRENYPKIWCLQSPIRHCLWT